MKNIRLDSGQAVLVATVFFFIVSLTVVFGLTEPLVRQKRVLADTFHTKQSYYLAEAGVEDTILRLKSGYAVSPQETLSLNGSSATINTSDVAGGKEINVEGDVNSLIRRISANLIIGEGITFHYGIQVGAGGFQMSNNAGVNGNIYANSNISGNNGAFVTGSAVSVTSINRVIVGTGTTGDAHAPNVTNSTIRGSLFCKTGSGNNKSCNTSLDNPTPRDFPIDEAQITEWKDAAALGGTVGSQTFSGANNILGPKKIQGNLTLSNNAKLIVTGTLWITGNLVTSNSSTVELASSYGSSGGIIIVDGTSTLSNGSMFEGSGTEGSYIMLLSTNNTSSAINLSNNAEAVVLYAPYGTVQLSNNANVKQITANTISLSNGAIIDYEQGLINSTFSSGPSGGYEIASWGEVE